MKIYLAARYSRHPELQHYAADLQSLGHSITARWVWGEHSQLDAKEEYWSQYALDDLDDLVDADCSIHFTEDPDDPPIGSSRGGRHVEFGLALAKRIYVPNDVYDMQFSQHRIIIVGKRENVFHYLPFQLSGIEQYSTWEQCYRQLADELYAT